MKLKRTAVILTTLSLVPIQIHGRHAVRDRPDPRERERQRDHAECVRNQTVGQICLVMIQSANGRETF